jgi:hypothetical protein
LLLRARLLSSNSGATHNRGYPQQDGDLVKFTEVVGMEELNTHKPIRVKNPKVGFCCGL